MTVYKDTPLAEITLRRYERPNNLSRRELVKKLCLSVGLLQPGDSRDIVVDILYIMLEAGKEKKALNSESIQKMVISLRKKEKLAMKGIAPSNIRRQLRRLKDIFLVEKINNSYRIHEFENLNVIFSEKIEKFYLNNILSRVRDYFNAVQK